MGERKRSRLLIVALAVLSGFGPLAIDLYLPGLPAIADELRTTESATQLTMGACLIGLAVGQLVAGPLSDRIGRRRPLLFGVAAFVVLSIVCAVAPTIEVLVAVRFLQGAAAAAGLVVTRAIVADLYTGTEAARIFSLLAAVSGLAPVIAPLIGGAVLPLAGWRGLFVTLAVIGVATFVLTLVAVPETLPSARRHDTGVLRQVREMGGVLRDRTFVLLVLVLGLTATALFSYISMSSFVFQRDLGFSPVGYSLIFAVNSAGLVLGTQLNVLLLRRLPLVRISALALGLGLLGSAGVLVAGVTASATIAVLVALFVFMFAQGLIGPNVMALALAPFTQNAGAASALLGTGQFLMGAALPPLFSLGGTSLASMGLWMSVVMLVALAAILVVPRRRPTPEPLTG